MEHSLIKCPLCGEVCEDRIMAHLLHIHGIGWGRYDYDTREVRCCCGQVVSGNTVDDAVDALYTHLQQDIRACVRMGQTLTALAGGNPFE